METKVIKIPKYILDFCNGLLQRKTECPNTEENPYTFTTTFSDGREVDIKVVNADPPYIDPVMFQYGFEEGCLEPCAETLDGEYLFESLEGDKYLVKVELDK